jgi:predicted solute-binding protein
MAIVHDDNLRLVEKAVRSSQMLDLSPLANSTSTAHTKETFTADAVLKYLRENTIPVFVENGGMCPASLRCMPVGVKCYFL